MLTCLYRHGPSRQRIRKGLIVHGQRAREITAAIVGAGASRGPGAIRLQTDRRAPSTIWFDTGMTWLHNARARDERFGELRAAIRGVWEEVASRGGRLLPNAVRPADATAWGAYVCDDGHLLETVDAAEQEIFCNLVRLHAPALIALTGRAGVTPAGVEPIGSRRLYDSSLHHAPRHFTSVSRRYLDQVVKEMRREDRLPGLDVLDVVPRDDPADGAVVELRFNDGQWLPSSVRADALLYQAILVRARRMARRGDRIEPGDHRVLNRDRDRAIAEGLRCSLQADAFDGPRDAPHDDRRRPAAAVSAMAAALRLLRDLQYEWRVLEVDYAEIAPLVLGPSLRQMGLTGLRNESDLLRALHVQHRGAPDRLLEAVAGLVGGSVPGGPDPLTAENERRHPEASHLVRGWWDLLLHLQETRPASRAPAPDRPARGPRGPEGHARPPRKPPVPALLAALEALEPGAPPGPRADCLAAYRAGGGACDLVAALRPLSPDDARRVREALRPPDDRCRAATPDDRAWDGPAAVAAAEDARRGGLGLLRIRVPADAKAAAVAQAEALRQAPPADLDLYTLEWRHGKDDRGASQFLIELLLARRGATDNGGMPHELGRQAAR